MPRTPPPCPASPLTPRRSSAFRPREALPETLFTSKHVCAALFLLLTQVTSYSTPSSTLGLSLLGRKQYPHTSVNTHTSSPSDPVTQLTLGNTSQSAELQEQEGPRRALLFTEAAGAPRRRDDSHRTGNGTVAETSPVAALSKWQRPTEKDLHSLKNAGPGPRGPRRRADSRKPSCCSADSCSCNNRPRRLAATSTRHTQ